MKLVSQITQNDLQTNRLMIKICISCQRMKGERKKGGKRHLKTCASIGSNGIATSLRLDVVYGI